MALPQSDVRKRDDIRFHNESSHTHEGRRRKDRRGVDVIFDACPVGRVWYGEPNAIGYAKFYNRSYHAVNRVYDVTGDVIETHEHAGEFKGW